jgi:hypothetical protein
MDLTPFAETFLRERREYDAVRDTFFEEILGEWQEGLRALPDGWHADFERLPFSAPFSSRRKNPLLPLLSSLSLKRPRLSIGTLPPEEQNCDEDPQDEKSDPCLTEHLQRRRKIFKFRWTRGHVHMGQQTW